MRRSLLPLLLVTLPAFAMAKPTTSVYVCAHPDDCILFMNPDLYNDIAGAADKVVVVYLTSGDAGLAFNQEAASLSYPYVREQASIDATEWAASAGKDPITAQQETEVVTVEGHDIDRVSYGNTASYFLRLPDGNFDGNGFELYNHESLRKLKNGDIDSITPIDNSAAYTGWKDVTQVLSGILSRETIGEQHVTLHIQDPDIATNTADHSDHTTGGSGVMEMLNQRLAAEPDGCYTIYKHIDYSIAQKPMNLEGDALENKSGSFAVLTATERHYLDHHDWQEGHTAYLGRNYYSAGTLPDGCDKQK